MMKKGLGLILLALMPVTNVLAKQDYTYVKSSLAFPWFIFFVIFMLILIPFVMVVVLSWKKQEINEKGTQLSQPASSPGVATASIWHKSVFNRIVLPSLLLMVGVFSILLVLNAYEAMDLMEQFGTAAPTMLNARP